MLWILNVILLIRKMFSLIVKSLVICQTSQDPPACSHNTNLSFLPHPLGQRDNLLVKESSLLHQSLLILRSHSLLMMSMMMMVFWFRWLLSLDPPVCSSQCQWSSEVPQCQLAACQWWTRGSWCAGRLWSPSPGALRSDHPWIPTFTHFQIDFQLSQIFHTHTHTHTWIPA